MVEKLEAALERAEKISQRPPTTIVVRTTSLDVIVIVRAA
jgi:hypothetical protein